MTAVAPDDRRDDAPHGTALPGTALPGAALPGAALPGTALPDAVRALIAAADGESLLRDADTLADGLAEAGWTPEVESGRFGADGWDLLSSAWPPNVSVFLDGHESTVRGAALAVAAAMKAEPHRWVFDSEGPDWSTWSIDDGRWDTDAIDWLEWTGTDVVVTLFTAGETSAGPGVMPAHLHLAIARADAPSEGLPRDDDRARRVQRDGSVVDRWYLTGEQELPDDVIAALESDPDPRVRAAAESERWLRERTLQDSAEGL